MVAITRSKVFFSIVSILCGVYFQLQPSRPEIPTIQSRNSNHPMGKSQPFSFEILIIMSRNSTLSVGGWTLCH